MVGSIPSPAARGFQVGPLDSHVYGLLYVVGLVVAVAITIRRWEAQGGSRATVYDVAMWGFPAGVVGGRLYFDLTSSGEMPSHWWGPFAAWDGGMGIWGGIALGTLVGIWRLRRGELDSLAAVGNVTDLPEQIATGLIGRLAEKVRQVVAHARPGRYEGGGGRDPGEALVLLNVSYPDLASWDPVYALLEEPSVLADQKQRSLVLLANLVDQISPSVRDRLSPIALGLAREDGGSRAELLRYRPRPGRPGVESRRGTRCDRPRLRSAAACRATRRERLGAAVGELHRSSTPASDRRWNSRCTGFGSPSGRPSLGRRRSCGDASGRGGWRRRRRLPAPRGGGSGRLGAQRDRRRTGRDQAPRTGRPRAFERFDAAPLLRGAGRCERA